ncbi:MAG: C10 family peptidase [Muribaculaceae bacterium]|nr:C10 family peptidase [Muribaculaceae bacterium]
MKKILTFTALALCSGSLFAAPLSPSQALRRAQKATEMPMKIKGSDNAKPVFTAKTHAGTPALYVFPNSEGFLLVSADDMAVPLLGYSDSGAFDPNNLPPQMEWWLGEYTRQIEAASVATTGNLTATRAEASPKEPIAPLMKSRWNQAAPYYYDCPVFEGKHCMTGCVATSMAQLMYYFKYPAIGMGDVKYTTETYKKELEIDFSKKPFDWKNMHDTYDSDATQADGEAVSYLMQCCGYSVSMNYTPNESSTMSYLIAPALINNFQYDKSLYFANRNTYSPQEWEDLIYDNLKNVGPVIYNGTSSLIGGHSFICDGYDGNGYFHINWGWGGTSDGYFLLDALNPETLGIGGGSGGFNFQQGAVIGAQPPVEGSEAHPYNLTQLATLQATCKDNTLVFSLSGANNAFWVNRGPTTFRFSMGAMFEPIDGTPGDTFTNVCYLVGTSTTGTLDPTFYYSSLRPSTSVEGMKDGKYKVTIVTKDLMVNDAPWVPVLCDYRYNNYVYVTKAGNDYTVEVPPTRILKVASVKVESDLYLECMAKIGITVTNNSDDELTQGFAPLVVYGGRNIMMGESMIIKVPAGETVSQSIYTNLYAMTTSMPPNNSKVVVRFYNPEDGIDAVYREAQTEVVLKKNPGAPILTASTIAPDLTPDDDGVYHLTGGDEFKYGLNFKVVRGYFAYPLYAIVKDAEGNTVVQKKIGENVSFMQAGNSVTLDVAVSYPQFTEGEIYETYVAYSKDYQLTPIGESLRFTMKKSGIGNVASDAEELQVAYDAIAKEIRILSASGNARIAIYDIAGTLMAETSANIVSTANLSKGVKIVVVTDTNGKTVTKKIII